MAQKVLIIEDDEGMLKIETKLLEAAGYEVFGAGRADEGMELAAKEKPDIILMDIRLPSKKRGIGTARLLREKEETRDTPIIFVTGYIQGEETAEVSNIPNCGYLTKPFEFSALLTEIKKYIG